MSEHPSPAPATIPQPAEYSGIADMGEVGAAAVLYEERENIAFVTINRPPLNRLDEVTTNALHDAWLRFSASDARVALLSAKGTEAFCGGANSWERSLDVWWAFPGLGVRLDKPVVAAVNGTMIGTGLSLIIFCDLVVAADNATFSYPEAKYGLAGGIATSLASRIPMKIATELLLLGDTIDARRAYEVGLINKVVPLGDEFDAALAYARTLASNAPRCVRMLKRFIGDTVAKSPPEIGATTRQQVTDVVFSKDRSESFLAMAEGRSPRYTGE
jgi:enoyl-CoA hydratase